MLSNIRWPELLFLLVVVLLLFGVGRISKVAGELGSGVRAFKKGLKGEEEENDKEENGESKDL
jgi:sec-independent protein translocase protein TatA